MKIKSLKHIFAKFKHYFVFNLLFCVINLFNFFKAKTITPLTHESAYEVPVLPSSDVFYGWPLKQSLSGGKNAKITINHELYIERNRVSVN